MKRIKNAHLTFSYVNDILSSLKESSSLKKNHFNESNYVFKSGSQEITLEQMIIGNITKYMNQQVGNDTHDIIFKVPANWGFKAKRNVNNLAHLSQFEVLGSVD